MRYDLVISAEEPAMTQFLARLDNELPGGWQRDRATEQRLRDDQFHGGSLHFLRQAGLGQSSAKLVLRPGFPGWSLDSLHPEEIRPLSDQEYEAECNAVLADFHASCIVPASAGLAVESRIFRKPVPIRNYLSEKSIGLLRQYLSMANHAQPSPTDRQVWLELVLQTHLDDSWFPDDVMRDWLAQEGLPEQCWNDVGDDYVAARRLLDRYDEERCRKCR